MPYAFMREITAPSSRPQLTAVERWQARHSFFVGVGYLYGRYAVHVEAASWPPYLFQMLHLYDDVGGELVVAERTLSRDGRVLAASIGLSALAGGEVVSCHQYQVDPASAVTRLDTPEVSSADVLTAQQATGEVSATEVRGLRQHLGQKAVQELYTPIDLLTGLGIAGFFR